MMNPFKNVESSKLMEDFDQLKECVSEWVIAIDTKQYELHQKLRFLESKLSEVENEVRSLR